MSSSHRWIKVGCKRVDAVLSTSEVARSCWNLLGHIDLPNSVITFIVHASDASIECCYLKMK
ncbi:hypothetical protein BVC80_1735g24 [Macleaya cordata]|uniref:Uncharacterized protein n=1 Tax=Macleaya cordata TaxID=56857 RepID=A0A200Q8W5_MACCD|nr:hypothetical protein BVC80_1735g24 [Macleaya cordata]